MRGNAGSIPTDEEGVYRAGSEKFFRAGRSEFCGAGFFSNPAVAGMDPQGSVEKPLSASS